MLGQIQAKCLFLAGDAQADGLFDNHKGDGDGHSRPCCHREHADALHAQLRQAAAVEQALAHEAAGFHLAGEGGSGVGCKQADCQRTPDAV